LLCVVYFCFFVSCFLLGSVWCTCPCVLNCLCSYGGLDVYCPLGNLFVCVIYVRIVPGVLLFKGGGTMPKICKNSILRYSRVMEVNTIPNF